MNCSDERNLSGQVSRRGLDLHFGRYQFQHEPDRQAFQGVLLALLKQVPLQVEIETLMQHWVYFYERSIGCVGVLKDWLIRAVAATLYDGSEVLTLEYLQDHALSLAQCERMALDATEGEQELRYAESRREPLWQLLASGMDASSIPATVGSTAPAVTAQTTSLSSPTDSGPKTTRRKRTPKTQDKGEATAQEAQTTETPPRKKRQTHLKAQTTASQVEKEAAVAQTDPSVKAQSSPEEAKGSEKPSCKKQQTRKKTPAKAKQVGGSMSEAEAGSPAESTEKPTQKKRQTRKKTPAVTETPDPSSSIASATDQKTELTAEDPLPQKKRQGWVGQRKPKRDPVGS